MSNRPRYRAVVVVPTFNARHTIGQTLSSIADSIRHCASTRGGADRIAVSVVDDASTDDTASLVVAFARTSPFDVLLTALEQNHGRGHARNRAVAAAAADCYFFLDHDDEYLPSHITGCLDALDADPRADFVKTGVQLSDPVHPDWEPRIAASLTQNLCIRAYCHGLVGGFHEEPEVEVFGCDDILYNRSLRACCRGLDTPARTVTFSRRPGNSFDRQFERKFSRPASEAEVTLSPRQLEVRARVWEIHAQRLAEVNGRLRRIASTSRRASAPMEAPAHD
ncbi:MAG: glycosyltransferase [Acidobacteria bacterium]|nr:glycosyltransferase [Acidobacteriota bacterium]